LFYLCSSAFFSKKAIDEKLADIEFAGLCFFHKVFSGEGGIRTYPIGSALFSILSSFSNARVTEFSTLQAQITKFIPQK
jgi:hypothetical protein